MARRKKAVRNSPFIIHNLAVVLQCIELRVLLAGRGPLESCAFRRVAASNLGVRWGVLRNDMAPPGSGYGVNEEKTSSGAGLFTRVGYHNGGALSRDIVSTCLAQDLFN